MRPTPIPGSVSLVVSIGSSSDDAYSAFASGWPGYSDIDISLYAGFPGGNSPVVGGWRWTGLNIPPGATILSAWVELSQAWYGYNLTTTLTFQDEQFPTTFSPGHPPAARIANRMPFSVPWTWNGPAHPGTWFSTPSLAAGIQELVDRYGWIDAVVLLEDGSGVTPGRYHSWDTYDADPAFAARLHLTFTQ